MASRRLEVDIYQVTDDSMMKKNRTDGLGWDWCWADWQRDWMNATPHRYAYRCLPLTIVNQTGWWIKNPVGFSATWRGASSPGSIDFRFDDSNAGWGSWINSQFGEGIITWNTPFLFRTRPEGSRLLICGPPNYFKGYAQPWTALIESDWISMSFTMNWKIMAVDQPVRFELGEPLFQAIPLVSNVCADLEAASVTFQRLADDPELLHAYNEWSQGRRRFHEQKVAGEVKPSDWQKDYFQGRDATGRQAASLHMQKIKPPAVRFPSSKRAEAEVSNPIVVVESSRGSLEERDDSSTQRYQASCPVAHKSGSGDQDMNPRIGDADRPTVRVQPAGHAPRGPAGSAPLLIAQQNGSLRNGPQQPSNPEGEVIAQSKIDDEWRRWIAENLMIGETPESLVDAMISAGISAEESAHEINAAKESPYVKGSELLRNRLRKRDWLLAVFRKNNRLHPQSGAIERRDRLSRLDFLRDYYSTNRPVIITGMMDDWPAMCKWNLDYFARSFGDREVEVQMGRTAGANYEIEREKYSSKIRFGDFIDKVRAARETNDFYLTANNTSSNRRVLSELWNDIVQIPEYLAVDRPGGFLWMGPKGTITPFHHDLTNNFMAQVIGRKRVKIAQSWDMPLMQNYLHCFSRIDGRVTTPSAGPAIDEPRIDEVVLNPGEVLFLPIGCLHYVEGIEISVTVSFTNFVFDNDYSSFYTTYGPV